MKHGITGIDHPVIAVRDMEAARLAWERLGFVVPPRGRHPEWGTGNWCIQFPREYIELRGLLEPTVAREAQGLVQFLEHGEGLMGVALGTTGARESHASLLAAGLHLRPVKPLTREFELPSGTIPVSFELCFLDPEEAPGLMHVVVCGHLTPERLRRAEWLRHPNRACGVQALIGVAQDPGSLRLAWERLFDRVEVDRNGISARFEEGGVIRVLDTAGFARAYPDLPLPEGELPRLALLVLTPEDMDATRAFFSSRGIDCLGSPRCKVPASAASGVNLEFVPRW